MNKLKRTLSESRMIETLCFRLLPTQVLLALVTAINGIVSGLFASNFVGTAAMGAIGLYGPINSFLSAVGMMLMGGAQILCGKYMGKNQQHRINGTFSTNLIACCLFSAAAIVLMLAAGGLDLTGAYARDAVVREEFNRYLLGMAICVFPQLMGQQLAGFLALENKTNLVTRASVVFIFVNLALDYLLVVRLQMGAFGLALASALGMWVYFGLQAQLFLRGKTSMKLQLREAGGKLLLKIMMIGAPGALSTGYLMLRGLVVNTVVTEHVGSIGLSAFAACDSLMNLFWAIPAGMLAVSRMLISVSVGEEDRATLQNLMRVAFYRYVPILLGVAAVVTLLARPMTMLYYQDTASPVHTMTLWGFRLLPWCMPLNIAYSHFICYGQASNKAFLTNLLPFLDGFVSVAVFTALLVPHMGLNGLFLANILNGFVSSLVVVGYSWAKNRRLPRNMEELMVIPAAFGVPENARMDLSLRSMEEVVQIARQIQSFLHGRGVDRRRAYFAALAVEEMAGNVVSRGFPKDKKQHTVDLRVACKDDDLILRIKDDCVAFDPTERRDIIDPEDITRNIGIRMVYSMAKDVKYQNILGLNVLTIRL